MTAPARTYGTLRLIDGGTTWELLGIEPHVSIRLKQLFPRIPTGAVPPYTLPHSDILDADLDWFTSRYPLAISDTDRAALTGGRFAFENKIAEMERILLPDYQPPKIVGLREGQSLRLYQTQAIEVLRHRGSLLLGDEGGLGKAQPLNAQVLTPSGWTAIGDLCVGDLVVDPDGGLGSVTGVFDRGIRDSYRVTLSDGTSTECCDEHLWLVQTGNDRFRIKERVLPLHDFMDRLVDVRPGRGIRSRYFIPCGKVDVAAGESLPVDPYLLGVLIGDGCLLEKQVRFSTADDEIIARLTAAIPDDLKIVKYKDYDYAISSTARGVGNSLVTLLRSMGLAGKKSDQKFIPQSYLTAAFPARLELLRGMMDTDGDCTPFGVSILTTTSEQLVAQVVGLVRSLGGLATVYRSAGNRFTHKGEKRQGRPSFRVNVRMRENPFHLPRKAERWKPSVLARAVRSVELVGPKPMRCIAVSTRRNLYFTDNHIVTHNTYTAGGFLCAEPCALPAAVVCDPHMQGQWKEKLETFTTLRVHVIREATPFITRIRDKKRVRLPYELPPADVYVFSITQIAGWADIIDTGLFKSAIYDEPQSLRTGTGTAKGRAAQVLSRHALFRLGLTATPIYNYGVEMWNVMQFIDEQVLGAWPDFAREWCRGSDRISDPKALGTYLREQHAMLRRLKADVGLELPRVSRIVEHIDYDSKVIASVEALARQLAVQATTGEFTERGQAVRELDMRVRHATGVAKAPAVARFVQILAEAGEKVIVWGWHREVYDIWNRMFKAAGLNPAMYTGTESPTQKSANLKSFIEGDANPLIMSLRSGQGVDGLQHICSTGVFGELDWSPGIHRQCIWRIDRDGQTKPVSAFFLVTDDGSDPPVMEVLGIKLSEATGIVDPHLGVEVVEQDTTNLQKLVQRYLARQGVAANGEITVPPVEGGPSCPSPTTVAPAQAEMALAP